MVSLVNGSVPLNTPLTFLCLLTPLGYYVPHKSDHPCKVWWLLKTLISFLLPSK